MAMRVPLAGIFGSLILSALGATNLGAQEPQNDPVVVAVRYVLGDYFRPASPEFLVDTLTLRAESNPPSPSMRSRVDQLAAALNARTGTLAGLFECDPRTLENYGRRCRRLTDVTQVLKVSEPKESDDGLLIAVRLTMFHDYSDSDRTLITSTTREVKLGRGESGVWRVVGEGVTTNAHTR